MQSSGSRVIEPSLPLLGLDSNFCGLLGALGQVVGCRW